MDEPRKFAYRQVLFFALIDIRAISGMAERPEQMLGRETGQVQLKILTCPDLADRLAGVGGGR
jgi:hypothetical protein